MRTREEWDTEGGRVRRLQVLQTGLLVAMGVAMLVIAIVAGRAVLGAQDRVDRATDRALQLQEVRGHLQDGFLQFWSNRFAGRPGVSAETRRTFTEEAVRIRRLATPPPTDDAEAAAASATMSRLVALGRIVGRDYGDVTFGTPADRANVRRAQIVAQQLDASVVAWAARADAVANRESGALRDTTRTLMLWLAVAIGALGAIAVIVFYLMERTRSRMVRSMRDEHAALGAVIASVEEGLAVLSADGRLRQANERLAEMIGCSRRDLLSGAVTLPYLASGDVPSDYVGERDLVITRPDGSSLPVILSAARLTHTDGGTGGRVHTLKDVSRRKAAETDLRALAAEQAALRRAATAVASGARPERVFNLIAQEVAGLLGVESGEVYRFDQETGRAEQMGAWTDPASLLQDPASRTPLDGGSATAVVYRTGEPARIVYRTAGEESSRLIMERGYRCGVAAPVRVGARLWGAVSAGTGDEARLPEGAQARLARFAELVGLTVANADARARLTAQAATDALTGLANHRTFHERLEHEVTRAAAQGEDLSLALFDLDRFKEINDTHGHQVGDAVLAEFARRLASEARYGELVARIGGEEFGWILPGSDGLNGWKAAERVRRSVSEREFPGGVGRVSVSAGVCDLRRATSGPDLLRLADGALYWAKSSGRDITVGYSPDVVQDLSVGERTERLVRSQAATALRALARAVDAKDSSTARHSERVADVAGEIAEVLGWDPGRIGLLREAALLHDVGKIGLPDALLLTARAFTPDERRLVEEHAALGAEIASEILTVEQVSWIRAHHERWDGRGYPDRLAADAIPGGARILAVADAWDAMTSIRTYHVPREIEEAIEECRRSAGTQFWPEAVDALERLVRAGTLTVGTATENALDLD